MATFYKDVKGVLVRDQNRFRKNYRYIRKKPRPLTCDDQNISNFTWGSFYAEFNDQTSVTHDFPCSFDTVPAVIATTVTKTGAFSSYNVFVSAVTKCNVTFETSSHYTGYVYYQALIPGVYAMPNIGRTLEVVTLNYANTNTKTYNFTASFNCIPIVTATADTDVNVFVTALTTSQVIVEVSDANYTGNVYLQAIERGC